MGLFDTVHCEFPLPDARYQSLSFQTKDLDCTLEDYTITREGRLVRQARRGRRGLDQDIEWPLHRDVSIYTSRDGVWVEYVVRFTHGRVEWIRSIEEAPHPPVLPSDWDPFPSLFESPGPEAEFRDSLPSVELPDDGRVATVRTSEEALLLSLRRDQRELEKLLAECSDHWSYEDGIYRFYHQSFKVYGLQEKTQSIVHRLRALAPNLQFHPWFTQIIESGTGKEFKLDDNAHWMEVTRPIVEAFFHARYFLDMAVRYANREESPRPLPSGYAALLSLFGIR